MYLAMRLTVRLAGCGPPLDSTALWMPRSPPRDDEPGVPRTAEQYLIFEHAFLRPSHKCGALAPSTAMPLSARRRFSCVD